MLQAYRFALDPTPTQERMLRSHCGAARVAFNWGLARVKAVMGQREAEATYAVLPRLGRIKLHEDASKLVERVNAGDARVMSAGVRFAGGRWFVSFTVDLARQVADASFGQIRRQLEYKTVWNGGRKVVAGRWFPSSKTCSGCGAVKAKLALSERTYVCTMCGLVLDRDVNAARNLALLGEAMVAGSGPETINGRGGEGVLALPAKRQPGTAQAGKAGTVQPRGRTALRELTNAH